MWTPSAALLEFAQLHGCRFRAPRSERRRPARLTPQSHGSRESVMPSIRRVASDRRQQGFASVMAIIAVIPMVGVAGTLLMVAAHERAQIEETQIVEKARDIAASGAQDAMARLTLNADYAGTYDLNLDGGTAHVVVTDWASDGIDNDGNGKKDDAGEADYVQIASEGRVNVAYDKHGNERS